MAYTLELNWRVYDDKDGSYIQVGPDADGLDMLEIRSVDADGRISDRITMPREQGAGLAEAITRYLTQRPEE